MSVGVRGVRIVGGGAAVARALLLAACGVEDGLGAPAGLDVADADRVEVRGVAAWDPGADKVAETDRLDTGFGESAWAVGAITDAGELAPLVRAVDEARFIDTGGWAYDLANPDAEVVFFRGDTGLARLGYYQVLSAWGADEVPGRWIDEQWRLLALTVELPAELLTSPSP